MPQVTPKHDKKRNKTESLTNYSDVSRNRVNGQVLSKRLEIESIIRNLIRNVMKQIKNARDVTILIN